MSGNSDRTPNQIKTDSRRGHTANDLNRGNTTAWTENGLTRSELDEIKRAIQAVKDARQESIECAKPFVRR